MEAGQSVTISKSATREIATVERVTDSGQIIVRRENGDTIRFNKAGRQIATSAKWFKWRIEN